MVLGYEGIGIVIKVGLKCSKIKVGDYVVIIWNWWIRLFCNSIC